MKKSKFLGAAERRKKDMRWLNWYISRGIVSTNHNLDAVARKELRRISWRRVH